MILSLLMLGVSLVVLGMWRDIFIDAWRTRPGSLSEGEGCAGLFSRPLSARPSGEDRTSLAPSESDCGYDSVLPDRIVTRHGAVVSLADHDEALL